MATLESLKDLATSTNQTIREEAAEVKSKMDDMQALIEELQQNVSDPEKIQEIHDLMVQNQEETRAIFAGE